MSIEGAILSEDSREEPVGQKIQHPAEGRQVMCMSETEQV